MQCGLCDAICGSAALTSNCAEGCVEATDELQAARGLSGGLQQQAAGHGTSGAHHFHDASCLRDDGRSTHLG